MKKVVALTIISTALTVSCNHRQTTRIDGYIADAGNVRILLKKVTSDKAIVVDSVLLKASGRFSFNPGKATGAIDFYQLAVDSAGSITLVVRPNDHITVAAQYPALLASCRISGSEDAALLLQLQQTLAQSKASLDSLLRMVSGSDGPPPPHVRSGISRLFVRQKRFNTAFIIKHPTSPASIMAYYQKLGRDLPLFGSPDDRFMLRMLADSLRPRFPKSGYVKALLVELDKLETQANRIALQEMVELAPVLDKPEVALPDTAGETQRLSELDGKVVLLDFWISTRAACLMDNRELMPLYKKYHSKGFEVFQASIDDDLTTWKSAVREHKLPWISVSCNNPEGYTTIQSYCVSDIPANFLIDRQGKIVGKNLYGAALEKKVKELLNSHD